jgi:hypothetical protein
MLNTQKSPESISKVLSGLSSVLFTKGKGPLTTTDN